MLLFFFIYAIIFYVRGVKLNKIDNEKRMKVFYFLVYVLIILIIVFATIKLLPLIIKLSNESTRNAAKEEIASMGIKGVFLVILLQVIQIVIAVIPGQPMEIISGMLYGTFGGMLICLIGIFIGTFIIFMIVRRLGMQFIILVFQFLLFQKIYSFILEE
jgi:uncharacterized membrane protein YdjX (TVP38/TMEM64 family)